MRRSRPAAVLLAGSLLLSACAGDDADEVTTEEAEQPGAGLVPASLEGVEVAATYGDEEITGDQLRTLVAAVGEVALVDVPEEEREAAEADLVRGLLTQELQVGLVRRYAAEEYGVEVSQAAIDERVAELVEEAGGPEAYADFLASQGQTEASGRDRAAVELLVADLQEAIAQEAGVDDAAVRAEYEQRAEEGLYDASTVRHILLETEEAAEAALARVQGGEDFSEVARDVSTGPSGPSGGELGSATRGAYVEQFEAAVWSEDTEVGEPLGPVETEFGFHIIIVDERTQQPFEEVADALRAELLNSRAPDAFNEAVDAAFSAVEVAVAPEIGVWDPELQQVVPADG